ncbi:MAG TPA: B12-binding domain-containing radical SAM protein [Anaeromyxobacteraceae bacterium]|nr:B12-binding domain-containing radical SAM protein [Anaeromyxobacteraceae bacterium]
MRALLVQARSPTTYWSYDHSLPFIGKQAILPPLGLATLAAHLPAPWELRIHDLHLAPLRDEQILWADAVLVSGMLVQAGSMRDVLRRARALGRRTVVGGPAPTTQPDAFPEADHVFLGEAEGRLDLLVATLESGGRGAPRLLSPTGDERPDLSGARVPRFDLLELGRYASHAIQFSRGCPFSCEFCDIIEIFGRVPRVKPAEQVIAELEALRRLGARGPLFVVDDNFIGNRRAVAKLLPRIAAWQGERGTPFDLFTEASVDLALHPELVKGMVEAGFTAVFLGIETPSHASLAEAGKKQNLRIEADRAVAILTEAGLEVFAGFIVGFDEDGEDIFDQQIRFLADLPVPRAMVGVLTALPGTALWRRLEKEGRLRRASTGDQFDRPNFATRLPEERLLAGYRRLLAEIYSPEAYYRRCRIQIERAPARGGPGRPGGAAALARAVWRLGVLSPRRGHFWRLAFAGLRRGTATFARAVTFAILGEHFLRYTAEDVLPRLDAALAEIRAGAAVASRQAAAPRESF